MGIVMFELMLLMHIIDDFVLQSFTLGRLKQKEKWSYLVREYGKFRYDYIMALSIHAMSWSIMILLPWMIFFKPNGEISSSIAFLTITNAIIHAVTDDMKANRYKINLIVDQGIHFLQILYAFIVMCHVTDIQL